MLQKEEIIYEYEQILLGKKKKYISSFIGTAPQKEAAAGVILHYAISNILHWDPETAKANITYDLLKSLCLDTVLKTIGIQPGKLDIFAVQKILQSAFPKEEKYSFTRQTIDIYSQVLNFDGQSVMTELPKNFFNEEDGIRRASICLIYAVSATLHEFNLRQLYDFFISPDCVKWLKDMKLYNNIKRMYDTPIEYFHYSLPPKQRNYIYFYNDVLLEKCQES